MSQEEKMVDYERAINWMNSNWPNCKKLDVNWTMNKYDYPEYVRTWIKETWIKESDQYGGVYCKVMNVDKVNIN
jgi:hypothetical protein